MSRETELSYNCPRHGLDAGCKCQESGYREAKSKRDKETELRRLRKKVKELERGRVPSTPEGSTDASK